MLAAQEDRDEIEPEGPAAARPGRTNSSSSLAWQSSRKPRTMPAAFASYAASSAVLRSIRATASS